MMVYYKNHFQDIIRLVNFEDQGVGKNWSSISLMIASNVRKQYPSKCWICDVHPVRYAT